MLQDMSAYGIGNTPLIELNAVHGNRLFVKLEKMNFLGSIKARSGYWMVRDLPAEAEGRTIVESTSGNLGLALGYFCRLENREFLCLVDQSTEKGKLEKLQEHHIAYEIVHGSGGTDFRRARIQRAQELMDGGGCYWVNQYDNLAGVAAHRMTTGPEIWAQTQGNITCCVCPIGSGGTICGVSQFLKSKSEKIQICGVEPFGSTIFGTVCRPYLNAGAGLAWPPPNLKRSGAKVDESFAINDRESICRARELHESYGLFVGITSGMAYAAALRLAEKTEGETIVLIAPDGGETYRERLEGRPVLE